LIAYLPAALVVAAGFFGTNYIAHGSLRPPYMHRGEAGSPDDWYHFTYARPGIPKEQPSYWSEPKGIDLGESSPAVYAAARARRPSWHLLAHPDLAAAIPGVVMLGWGRDYRLRELALLIAAVTIVCVGFTCSSFKPLDRNYGGMTSGLRWVFWMAPLWLLPRCRRPIGSRRAAGPRCRIRRFWRSRRSRPVIRFGTRDHPWLTNLFIYLGWTKF